MRRRVLIGLGVVGCAGALAGCGFELRRPPEMPFATIALTGFAPHSPLERELRRSLGDRVRVVDDPGRADVVLRVLQVRLRFDFQLTDPGGHELGPATELLLSRDMSYSETYALAKAQEEDELFAAMQSDVVRQVTRRLAQVRLQTTAPQA